MVAVAHQMTVARTSVIAAMAIATSSAGGSALRMMHRIQVLKMIRLLECTLWDGQV